MKKEHFPGVLLAAFIAVLAIVLKGVIGFLGAEMWALLLGVLGATFFAKRSELQPGIAFSEKKILGWAIALMGLQLSIEPILKIGPVLIPVILVMMFGSLFFGVSLARKFGLSPKTGLLIGTGNAICGAGAIMAASPAIGGKPRHTATALSTVYILGTLGMFAIPFGLSFVNWSDLDKGLLAGATLQAVGQAVAAGFAMGENAGEMATLVKLFRVTMLGPIVLLLSLFINRSRGGAKKSKLSVPDFIIAFAVFAVVAQLVSLPGEFLSIAKEVQKFFLTLAMAAIGASIRIKELAKEGLGALGLGLTIFVFQLVLIISFILLQNQFFGN
jgi:uncharacterized integral membrane protein (TIGR00698 family)